MVDGLPRASSLESCYSLIIQKKGGFWFALPGILCQAYFSYCWDFFLVLFGLLRIVIFLSNKHVSLLHYEDAEKQTCESLRMT